MKTNKVILVIGVGLLAWYMWDKFGGEDAGKKKDSPAKKKPGSSGRKDSPGKTEKPKKPAGPESRKESKKENKESKEKGGGKYFDFFWSVITGNDVNPTATDEQEYQGADKNKTGPFKGYTATGYWNAYLDDEQTKRWLKTADGRKWQEKLRGYLAAQKKEGGALTKKEVEATRKYVPLPKSAPTRKYRDAQGTWYKQRGDVIKPYVPGLDVEGQADSLADALRKQADAVRGRHG